MRETLYPLHGESVLTRVGFSGPEEGMSKAQRVSFCDLIAFLDVAEFHHGVCVGADAQAHVLVRRDCPDAKIVGHPGVKADGSSPKRSVVESDLDVCLPERPYLERNGDIARLDVLVATPGEYSEKLRSGTWTTIRRARVRATPILTVFPDGRIDGLA